jgi:hypothetical protein
MLPTSDQCWMHVTLPANGTRIAETTCGVSDHLIQDTPRRGLTFRRLFSSKERCRVDGTRPCSEKPAPSRCRAPHLSLRIWSRKSVIQLLTSIQAATSRLAWSGLSQQPAHRFSSLSALAATTTDARVRQLRRRTEQARVISGPKRDIRAETQTSATKSAPGCARGRVHRYRPEPAIGGGRNSSRKAPRNTGRQ